MSGLPTRRAPLLVGAAVVLLLVVGVVAALVTRSGPHNDQPPLDTRSLRPGACASVGAVLADARRQIGDLRSGVRTPQQVVAPLAADQKALEAVAADPEVGLVVTALRSEIGLLRIGVAAETFMEAQKASLGAAQVAVERQCVVH